jgi:hypothetical protein
MMRVVADVCGCYVDGSEQRRDMRPGEDEGAKSAHP